MYFYSKFSYKYFFKNLKYYFIEFSIIPIYKNTKRKTEYNGMRDLARKE